MTWQMPIKVNPVQSKISFYIVFTPLTSFFGHSNCSYLLQRQKLLPEKLKFRIDISFFTIYYFWMEDDTRVQFLKRLQLLKFIDIQNYLPYP